MAARDRYSYEVKCPQCGQIGVFLVSEDDYPFMTSPDRVVEKIEGNFSATVKRGVDVFALCKTCNITFKA